jgi:hypothetical protein
MGPEMMRGWAVIAIETKRGRKEKIFFIAEVLAAQVKAEII